MLVAFITGANGQDGSYLTEFLLEKGYVVHGLIRRSSTFNTERIEHIRNHPNLFLHYGDITDGSCLVHILTLIKNKYEDMERLEIYNLAAQSHVQVSFEVPQYTGQSDGFGVLLLLEAIRNSGYMEKIRMYQASTSELYGNVVDEKPLNEDTPFSPCSPYAVAKLYAYYIVKNYREAYGMYAVNGVLFNHESARRPPTFISRKITIGLSKILKDENEILTLGNIYSKRDFGYAKNFVVGMWMMLQQNKPDDFVLATGETHTVKEFVEEAFKLRNFNIIWKGEGVNEVGYDENTGRILVKIDKKYYRPCEVPFLLGDSSKAEKILGWKPETKFKDLVKLMVDYDCK